jgi:hypothetical protein
MGKIYGVHDSYCDLVGPSGGGPGAIKFCTCDSGKKTNYRIHEDAERRIKAEAYADDFLGQILGQWPGALTDESKTKWREVLINKYLSAHPEVERVPPEAPKEASPVAPAPPEAATPAPDGDPGPGEEDGPWAEGWGSRAGESAHEQWYRDNLHWIRLSHPDKVTELWAMFKTNAPWGKDAFGVALNAAAHPFAAKSDAGKPKPFQFFMQQFPLGIKAVAAHMEKGCSDPGHVFLGWTEVENGFARYTDAMLRHLLEEINETITDIEREEGYDREWAEEQGAIAVAANAMIRLELLLRRRRNLNLDASGRA